MNDQASMNWKAFTIRMVEALRWPIAWVIIFLLLRGPIGEFISTLATKIK